MKKANQSTEEITREILLSGNEHFRTPFMSAFGDQVEQFVGAFARAYRRFREVEPRVPADERSAWSQMFLYSALNSTLTSTHLLLAGFLASSGNLMRHFGESIAMALLLSHRQLDVFERFVQAPSKYSVNKAMAKVSQVRTARVLKLDRAGWNDFVTIGSFFDQYSHASALTTATLMAFDKPGMLVLGTEYDEQKREPYRKEISLRVSACERIHGVVEHVEDQLIHSEHA